MLHRFPNMRAYMWSQWLLAFKYPEILANSDPDNMWARLECMRKASEDSQAECLVFGSASEQFLKGREQFYVLEGYRKLHSDNHK